MQIEMGGGLAIDLLEEDQELVCPMAGQTFTDDFAGRDVERISLGMLRTLQCVALTGRSFTVFSTTLSLIAALIGFRPGGLERPSTRPSTPASAKYSCQRQTVVLATPTSRMIAMTPCAFC